MPPKIQIQEVSAKSTKEQILAAYNEALTKLNEKSTTPEEQKKQEKVKEIVVTSSSHSSDGILSDLSNLKSKTIKQIDNLSEQLLIEFQKLTSIREAITFEQKHLQELYQINETANTLSALLQAQVDQKQRFSEEAEASKKEFEQEMYIQKAHWQEQKEQFEKNYKEQKDLLEKTRKREEEEYVYTLEIKKRKEIDEYNNRKATMEKELSESKNDLLKREEVIKEKEQFYESLKIEVDQIPNKIKEAVSNAQETLRIDLQQKYEFETKLKSQEYQSALKLREQNIQHLEEKIKKQESMVKELSEKADMATNHVQSIACRALDASAARFVTTSSSSKVEDKST